MGKERKNTDGVGEENTTMAVPEKEIRGKKEKWSNWSATQLYADYQHQVRMSCCRHNTSGWFTDDPGPAYEKDDVTP